MSRRSNFRLLLIRLLTITCFVGGITSAPIDTEIDSGSGTAEAEKFKEEMLPSESRLAESIRQDTRATPSIPFLGSIPNPLTGKETPGSAGLPGVPDFGAAASKMKAYFGTFQLLEVPGSSLTDMAGAFANLPTLPGLPNFAPVLGANNS